MMKQGPSKTIADYKTEPRSRAVSEAAVADLGIHHVRTRSEPLYEGRGYEAPKNKSTIHHCGSQGKH